MRPSPGASRHPLPLTRERALGEAPYLLGAEPSVADFALYGALHCLPYTKNEIPRELPHVRKWYSTVETLGKK